MRDGFRFSHAQGEVHVEVVASVVQPELACSKVSNTFNFVFGITSGRALPGDGCGAPPLKRVLPSSAEEAARVLKHRD